MAQKPKKLPQKIAMLGKTNRREEVHNLPSTVMQDMDKRSIKAMLLDGCAQIAHRLKRHKKILWRIALVFLLIPFWIFLRSIYRDRIGAFGCFDDCNNIMGGYFLLSGKKLFSEIFFNHMPFMAYISYAIQWFTKPDSIVMLISQHRMIFIYISMIANMLLTLRFGVAGFGFALLYESTKGFIFGERFLAEAIIIYPIVYLWGVVWECMRGRKISPLEVWLATNLTWFVIFMREPYIPLVLMLFGAIVWHMRKTIWSWWSVILLGLMSWATVYIHGVSDFIFNVYSVNRLNIDVETKLVSAQTGGTVGIVLYPIFIFFQGVWNMLHIIEAVVVGMLLVFVSVQLRTPKNRFLMGFLFVVLTLANIRAIVPGTLYYAAFHHIQWYGLAIFTVALFIQEAWRSSKARSLSVIGGLVFMGLVFYAVISPQSFLHEKVDRQTEFTTNYGHYYVVGDVVRLLSDPTDTLFLDGQDDLIYWHAKRPSSYGYSWYTSLMPYYPIYTKARDDMFATSPPTFYYGRCSDQTPDLITLPESVRDAYVRLKQGDTYSCLYVRKEKLNSIPADRLEKIKQFNYMAPGETLR